MSKPIPHPPGLPFLGNILDVQDEVPIRGLENLADVYGPIYRLRLRNQDRIIISSHALLNELCDEKRFWKTAGQALSSLSKESSARGLFTAPTEADPDWQQAHRTLIPAFGPLAIQEMFDGMLLCGNRRFLHEPFLDLNWI
jgi:cytochrome P450 / NADPH-cytochrome P450 reductase